MEPVTGALIIAFVLLVIVTVVRYKKSCKHKWEEVGVLRPSDKVVLYCPKCDSEKRVPEVQYDIDKVKEEIKREYNKSKANAVVTNANRTHSFLEGEKVKITEYDGFLFRAESVETGKKGHLTDLEFKYLK